MPSFSLRHFDPLLGVRYLWALEMTKLFTNEYPFNQIELVRDRMLIKERSSDIAPLS